MKRLTNLLVVALLMLSFTVLVSSCKKDEVVEEKYYIVYFTFTGDIENVSFYALNLELDDKGNVLTTYQFDNVNSGSKTKTYTAHKDAVKVKTLITYVIHDSTYGNIQGEDVWEFNNELTKNAIKEIHVSLNDFKYELDLKKNIKASAIIE